MILGHLHFSGLENKFKTVYLDEKKVFIYLKMPIIEEKKKHINITGNFK